jgi:hypothetical protein
VSLLARVRSARAQLGPEIRSREEVYLQDKQAAVSSLSEAQIE